MTGTAHEMQLSSLAEISMGLPQSAGKAGQQRKIQQQQQKQPRRRQQKQLDADDDTDDGEDSSGPASSGDEDEGEDGTGGSGSGSDEEGGDVEAVEHGLAALTSGGRRGLRLAALAGRAGAMGACRPPPALPAASPCSLRSVGAGGSARRL